MKNNKPLVLVAAWVLFAGAAWGQVPLGAAVDELLSYACYASVPPQSQQKLAASFKLKEDEE